MALSFPADFPSTWRVGNMLVDLARADATAPDGTGRGGGVQIGDPLWGATMALECITDAQAISVAAKIRSLKGSIESIQIIDPMRRLPQAYRTTGLPGGATGVASSYSVDSTRSVMTLNGLTAGLMITTGDLIGVMGGAGNVNRLFVEALEDGTVAGGGSVTLTIGPALSPAVDAWAGTDVAYLIDPSCTMKLTAETSIGATTPEGRTTHQIVLRQYIAAE